MVSVLESEFGQKQIKNKAIQNRPTVRTMMTKLRSLHSAAIIINLRTP